MTFKIIPGSQNRRESVQVIYDRSTTNSLNNLIVTINSFVRNARVDLGIWCREENAKWHKFENNKDGPLDKHVKFDLTEKQINLVENLFFKQIDGEGTIVAELSPWQLPGNFWFQRLDFLHTLRILFDHGKL